MRQETNLFLLGPQGCGKGTQGMKLVNFHYVEMSNLLRKTDDEIIASKIACGELVNDDDVLRVWQNNHERLREDSVDYVVNDGIPRSPKQALGLLEILGNDRFVNHQIVVIRFDLSPEICHQRMIERARRDDLMAETREKRLSQYFDTIDDILAIFTDSNIPIYPIESSGPIDGIRRNLENIISPFIPRTPNLPHHSPEGDRGRLVFA